MLVRLWNHTRIRSWHQPVLRNNGVLINETTGPTTSTLQVRPTTHCTTPPLERQYTVYVHLFQNRVSYLHSKLYCVPASLYTYFKTRLLNYMKSRVKYSTVSNVSVSILTKQWLNILPDLPDLPWLHHNDTTSSRNNNIISAILRTYQYQRT